MGKFCQWFCPHVVVQSSLRWKSVEVYKLCSTSVFSSTVSRGSLAISAAIKCFYFLLFPLRGLLLIGSLSPNRASFLNIVYHPSIACLTVSLTFPNLKAELIHLLCSRRVRAYGGGLSRSVSPTSDSQQTGRRCVSPGSSRWCVDDDLLCKLPSCHCASCQLEFYPHSFTQASQSVDQQLVIFHPLK